MARNKGLARSAPSATNEVASTGASSLTLARLVAVEGRRALVAMPRGTQSATVDPCVHPALLASALTRGERVLVESVGETLVVVGALRTQPSLGFDRVDQIDLEAEQVTLRGRRAVTLVSEAASVTLRAEGEVETVAPQIHTRAEGLHRIVGRMLKLN
jgi:hypothetical protein